MTYESLKDADVKNIEALQRRIDSTVEILTSDLKFLIESLESYKESTHKMISASLQEADILVKYSNGHNDMAYNLPGVFSNTVSTYDLAEMRGDNKKLKELQDEHKSCDKQRSSSYSMISGTYSNIRSRLNLLANDNQEVTSRLEDLKDINEND